MIHGTPNRKHMETFRRCLVIKHMSRNMSARFQRLGTHGPEVWLHCRWNHFSCGCRSHLAQRLTTVYMKEARVHLSDLVQWPKHTQWIYDDRQHDFFLSFGLKKKKYRSLEGWEKTCFFLCWSIFCESDLNCFVCCVYDSRTGEEKVYESFICFPSVKTCQEKIFFQEFFTNLRNKKKKKVLAEEIFFGVCGQNGYYNDTHLQ